MSAWGRDLAAAGVGALRPRRGKRIVLLHEVADRDSLRRKLVWLLDRYRVGAVPALVDEDAEGSPQVALTFDDGYRSWYDVAAPLLVEFSIPALFFVCSGFVGLSGAAAAAFCAHRLRRRSTLEPLAVAQLRELAAHPLFEIGSHTVNHADLGAVGSPGTLETEIGADRRRLEDWTGRAVRWFAFPFGQPENTSGAARTYLREQGFTGAFTLVPSFAGGAERFAIGRDSLDLRAPAWVWRGRLAGGYDGLYRLKRRFFRAD